MDINKDLSKKQGKSASNTEKPPSGGKSKVGTKTTQVQEIKGNKQSLNQSPFPISKTSSYQNGFTNDKLENENQGKADTSGPKLQGDAKSTEIPQIQGDEQIQESSTFPISKTSEYQNDSTLVKSEKMDQGNADTSKGNHYEAQLQQPNQGDGDVLSPLQSQLSNNENSHLGSTKEVLSNAAVDNVKGKLPKPQLPQQNQGDYIVVEIPNSVYPHPLDSHGNNDQGTHQDGNSEINHQEEQKNESESSTQQSTLGTSTLNNTEGLEKTPARQNLKIDEFGNAVYFETVEQLLKQQKLNFNLPTKGKAYEDFILSLTDNDKKTVMQYSRCISTEVIPNIFDIGDLSNKLSSQKTIRFVEDVYQYQKSNEWFVNFADCNLFGFYYSDLYAQDELQVLEHPLLAHMLENLYLIAQQDHRYSPLTYISSQPTPILITNAYRLGHIDLSYKNNPYAFYGNDFYHMTLQQLKERITIFNEAKTKSNIIAMAAIGYEQGSYTKQQIEFTLLTAYKAYSNAVKISKQNKEKCIINTGNWGCGAFGNNPIIIAVIQIFAAHLANVDELVYHTFNPSGTQGFKFGVKMLQNIIKDLKKKNETSNFISLLIKQNLKWGVSNGS